ncbi:MAG: aminoacyl-tRNA hydrolase [Actinomycetota bacterium]|nr:aminoacyl-tRNA hydrolase [Actinomycetota bacterium]
MRLSRTVSIPDDELVLRFSRSSGPGGQSVNTTSSQVELRFDVEASGALTPAQKRRLRSRLAGRVNKEGVLVLRASEHRSQLRNREAVLDRFSRLVTEALSRPRPRRPTRPTRTAREDRLRTKRRRSRLKGWRGRVDPSA